VARQKGRRQSRDAPSPRRTAPRKALKKMNMAARKKTRKVHKLHKQVRKNAEAFLHLENRLIRLFRNNGISEQAAKNLAKEADKKLQRYYKHHTARRKLLT
jgi:hypothetical protein